METLQQLEQQVPHSAIGHTVLELVAVPASEFLTIDPNAGRMTYTNRVTPAPPGSTIPDAVGDEDVGR